MQHKYTYDKMPLIDIVNKKYFKEMRKVMKQSRFSTKISLVAWILVLIMVVGMVGCSDDKGGEDNSKPGTSDESKAPATEDSGTSDATEAPSTGDSSDATEAPFSGVTLPADTSSDDNYVNSVDYKLSSVVATDDLGRELAIEGGDTKDNRYVGIFYFLWAGQHGTDGPYDNSIIAQKPGALDSEAGWIAAGGGERGKHHFWGEPLFGYYVQSDKWVMRKHVQMLTDADIDFLVFDTTNGYPYASSAIRLIKILDEYSKAGWDVPKIAFMTNTNSGTTMTDIYKLIYEKYPEYSHLWFNWDGKPMIIGKSAEASDEVKAFFRIKESQWPIEGRKDDGFPWMEFDTQSPYYGQYGRIYTDDAIYGLNGRKEVVSVSIAQHSDTVSFSATSWYGHNDRTRSWHDGKNDTSENAYLYGYNFIEQFEWAINVDPEIIFITGWNEWVAQRQPPEKEGEAIHFIDCSDANGSRDAEPMKGGYGDNYYIQMMSYIRKYKGTAGKVQTTNKTIDIAAGFSQWNNVVSYYKDFEDDAIARKSTGFGGVRYTDNSNRNDISEMKVCEDNDNVYFFVKTMADITAPEGDNWMNLFISAGDAKGWDGYNYVLNYKTADANKAYLGKLADSDDYSVSDVSQVDYRVSGNMMMVKIPKADLGIKGAANISFKWSDNCTTGDVFGFYTTGDAAPIGRAGYYYGS